MEAALLSLCRVGPHSCHVWGGHHIAPASLSSTTHNYSYYGRPGSAPAPHPCQFEALEGGGVRVRFSALSSASSASVVGGGQSQDYIAVICTARNPSLVPELTLTNEELQRRAENGERLREKFHTAPRWLEMCVPPLPELRPFEKRFTPGSQEVVEMITPREAKLIVRPTMLTTKLFYHVLMTIPDSASDPTLKSTSTRKFWEEVARHWTAGVPGSITHTLFRPLFSHMQQHFHRPSALVYKTPHYLLPHWLEGEGRIIKVAHAAHGAAADGIDVGEAQGFSDCFALAKTLSESVSTTASIPSSSESVGGCQINFALLREEVEGFVARRQVQVLEEHEHHSQLLQYAIRERSNVRFILARLGMKIMKRYKKSWKAILKNHVTLLPKHK